MLDIMAQARNAMQAYQTKLQAITSNISNMSVTGFKRTDVSFEETFSKMISSGTSPDSSLSFEGGTNPVQTGGTAAVASSSVDFTMGQGQGGALLDVMINDPGKLLIVSPDGGNTYLYTRAGEFQVINDKLVTSTGMQVYGFARSSDGTTSNSLMPIDLTNLNPPTTLTFDQNGVLRESSAAGAAALPYQLAVTTFQNPSGLLYRDGTSFAASLSSGEAQTPTAANGIIAPRTKEASNVAYTSEVIDSIEIQRALDANLTVVRLVSDVISNFINKLG